MPGDTTGKSIIATSKGSAEKGETAQIFGQGGIINNPAKNTIGLRINKGSLDIVIGQMNYQIPLPENQGETLVYSTDENGVVQSKILLSADGKFSFNDGTDNAVRYSELETALNNFKTSIDLENTTETGLTTTGFSAMAIAINAELVKIAGILNGLVPNSYTPTPIVPSVVSASPTQIDISSSKIEEIKVP